MSDAQQATPRDEALMDAIAALLTPNARPRTVAGMIEDDALHFKAMSLISEYEETQR